MFSSRSLLYTWHRWKRKFSNRVELTRTLIVVALILFIFGLGYIFANPIKHVWQKIWYGPQLVSAFFQDPLYILPSYNGYTNLLVLGLGGEGHDGGELTDTILFASLDLKQHEVSILSIPRDIWVSSVGSKINGVYAFGEQQATGSGRVVLEDAVYEIIDQPIHYVVQIDFDGFIKTIDALGGVEVEVKRSFIDKKYPIKGKENDLCNGDPDYGCRYETLQFEAGKQLMDGKTALKFVRSRHAEGDEGTDFARSQRQQLVIKAIMTQVMTSQVMFSPSKWQELLAVGNSHFIVDPFPEAEKISSLAGFVFQFWRNGKAMKTISLETGDEENPGFLVNPPLEDYEGQWVLVPRSGDWVEFQGYFRQMMERGN